MVTTMSEHPTPQTAAALHHEWIELWQSVGPEAVAERLSWESNEDLIYYMMMHIGTAAQ